MSQSTDLALESWGIPWELPVFSLRWDPEEVGSKISKRTSQQQDWRTRQWEWGQEGQKQSPPSIASALGCHRKVWYPNSHMSPRVIIWWMIAALHPQFLASDFQLTRMRRKCFVCFGIGLCLLRRPPAGQSDSHDDKLFQTQLFRSGVRWVPENPYETMDGE